MSEQDWRDRYAAVNSAAVGVAMSALYDTHVEGEEVGNLRGIAVRAVSALANALGRKGLIQEMEQTPHSVRRRSSPLWREVDE